MAAEAKTNAATAAAAFADVVVVKKIGDVVTMPEGFEAPTVDGAPTEFMVGPFGPYSDIGEGKYMSTSQRMVTLAWEAHDGGSVADAWQLYHKFVKRMFSDVCIESPAGTLEYAKTHGVYMSLFFEEDPDHFDHSFSKWVHEYMVEQGDYLFRRWLEIMKSVQILMDPTSSQEQCDEARDFLAEDDVFNFHMELDEFMQFDISAFGDQFANIVPPEKIEGTYPEAAFSVVRDAVKAELLDEFQNEDTVSELMELFNAAHDIRMKLTLFGAMKAVKSLVADLSDACFAWRTRLTELREQQ